jgi:hypothetical protein
VGNPGSHCFAAALLSGPIILQISEGFMEKPGGLSLRKPLNSRDFLEANFWAG